jgi:hypothetical protein
METIKDIDTKINYIKANTSVVISDRVAELDKWIKILPDRQPTKPGNTTMKQYLSQLKNEVVKDPQKYVEKEITRLERSKLQFKTEPLEMEKL